jgi:hypothetical protein
MRIEELLRENRIPELKPISGGGDSVVVVYKGRKLTITGGRGISTRRADFSIGAWNFSMDGGAQLPCWVTGPGTAVCSISS